MLCIIYSGYAITILITHKSFISIVFAIPFICIASKVRPFPILQLAFISSHRHSRNL